MLLLFTSGILLLLVTAAILRYVPDKAYDKLRFWFYGLFFLIAAAVEIPWFYMMASGLVKAVRALS